MRKCSKCKQKKSLSEFHIRKRARDGVNEICKACRIPIGKEEWKNKSFIKKILDRLRGKCKREKIPFNLSSEDIFIPMLCPVLRKPLKPLDYNWTPSVDRINPHLGYVKGNVNIISNRANMIKNDASSEELFAVYNYTRQYGI